MDKTSLLNKSMKNHLIKVKDAVNMTEIIADDFIGIECDIKTIENIESLINQLKELKVKLAPNKNICPICGINVYTATPYVTEEDGTKTHLECWYKK